MLNDHLKTLHPDTLASLRDYYRDMAGQCSDLEEIKSRRAERRAYTARKAVIAGVAARVAALRPAMPEADAIAEISVITELPQACIAANVALARRAADEARRFARDREIMRLARRGHSNAEIGREVRRHPGTVSRIIQAALRDGGGR